MTAMKFLFALLQLALVSAWDDLVMPPLDGKTGPTVVLLYGQGASIPTEEYEALGLAIQEAASYPLWFGVPQCPDNIASIPGGLEIGNMLYIWGCIFFFPCFLLLYRFIGSCFSISMVCSIYMGVYIVSSLSMDDVSI